MNYPPQSGGPGDGVVIPVSSLPTHEGAEIARLTRALADSTALALAAAERVVKVEAESEGLRQMLARFVSGRHCPAPKWSKRIGGLVACRECRTCEAAVVARLVDFGTGWVSP